MVILHTETLKNWGGQQNRVLSEAIGLRDIGHKVVIVCNRGSELSRRAKISGIKFYEVNMAKHANLTNILKIAGIIRKEAVEIVSTHSSVDSWAGGIAAKLTGRKLVRFRHNVYPIGRDPLTRIIYLIPDRIVAISDTIRDLLINYGIKRDKIEMIFSSVNTNIFSPDVEDLRKELNIPDNTVVIGNTSGFTRIKGQRYLLQAFNSLYNKFPCVLIFAGRLNKSSKERYLSHVKNNLREKIIFLDHRDDIPRVLKTIDIFVSPSVVEGLGTALHEAMAMEKPVVVSDIAAFREYVNDKVNGLFFRAEDPEDMAEKIIFLHKDRDLRKKMGDNARKTALERFSLDRMVELSDSLYRKVLHAC
jgi:glycosyltransferase involved in cell wall biosynthesis